MVATDDLRIRPYSWDSDVLVDGGGVSDAFVILGNGVQVWGLEANAGDTAFPPGLHGWLILGDDNVLRGNTGSGSHDGFLTEGNGNFFMDNTAKENFAGFADFGADNVFRHNLAMDNPNVGFGSGGMRMQCRGNVTIRCGFGFLAQGAPGAPSVGAEFSNNVAIDSIIDGFNLGFCADVTVRNNDVYGADGRRDGIRLNDVSDSRILNNLVVGAGNNGFSMDDALDNPQYPGTGSFGNEFRNNDSYGNGVYGFYVNIGTGTGHVYGNNTCGGNGAGGSNLPGICD